MKLTDEQMKAIQKACDEVDFGSVTIKMNRESKFVDIVVEKQIRLQKESTQTSLRSLDKKYN